MVNKFLLIVFSAVLFVSCQQEKYAGVSSEYYSLLDSALVKADQNAEEIKKALDLSVEEQKNAMAFLISYMPQRDLTTLSAEYLLENVEYAYKARNEFPWCKDLSEEVFFNEVLPYVNITEEREQWRKGFYERFKPYLAECKTLEDAIEAINKNIKEETGVEYNVKRSRVDISPLQAIKEHMATCTGLSILLTDAFRSVGIPSRIAGTPMWTNMKGNHTWSEVLINGQWRFTEFYWDALDKSWFLADAGKADPDNKLHWIYAVSYKPTEIFYEGGGQLQYLINELDENMLPEVWRKDPEERKMRDKKLGERYIYGVNVTQRYIDLYRANVKNSKLKDDEVIANFVVFKDASASSSQTRISSRVELWKGDKRVDFGYSPKPTDDNNNFLKFKVKKGEKYVVKISDNEGALSSSEEEVVISSDPNFEYKLSLNK